MRLLLTLSLLWLLGCDQRERVVCQATDGRVFLLYLNDARLFGLQEEIEEVPPELLRAIQAAPQKEQP